MIFPSSPQLAVPKKMGLVESARVIGVPPVTGYEFTELDRHLTHQEMQMLVSMSGVFEAVAWLGRLDINQPLTTDRKSYRMIPVLKKIGQ